MKKISTLLVVFTLFISGVMYGQSIEEMTQERNQKAEQLAQKEATLKALSGEVEGLKSQVAGLTDKLTPYPRWKTGVLGTVGLNLANFSNWFQKESPNTSAISIGLTANAFANLQQKKYFWRNGGNLNLGWIKFDNKDIDTDETALQVTSDAFNLTSLFGYKLSEKIAISTLGEYRTAILEGRFNDPGYLDLGVGATWTPMENLVVVVHPLNYNFVFASDGFEYQSSLGAKVVADYTAQITDGVAWRSNLSAFLSYKDMSELSNWTWVNSFSTAVKGVGVGLEIGLRKNMQEARATEGIVAPTTVDNPIQTYWVLGLSYAIVGK